LVRKTRVVRYLLRKKVIWKTELVETALKAQVI
jgi:hypothetical protein